MHSKFRSGNLKGQNRLEVLDADGRTIKIDLKKIGWGGVDCIQVAQDRDQWRAVVDTN
jgi:hypothetical protein